MLMILLRVQNQSLWTYLAINMVCKALTSSLLLSGLFVLASSHPWLCKYWLILWKAEGILGVRPSTPTQNSTAAYVNTETPVLPQSLKASIMRLESSQMDQTFWGVVSAAVRSLGPLGVRWDTLLPWPSTCGSAFGGDSPFSDIRILGIGLIRLYFPHIFTWTVGCTSCAWCYRLCLPRLQPRTILLGRIVEDSCVIAS